MTGSLIKIKIIIKCSPCQNTIVYKHYHLRLVLIVQEFLQQIKQEMSAKVCCSCPPSAPISLKTQQHMDKPLETPLQ